MLVGVMAVFAGLMTSFYGYYFWPTTGDGFLLNTIASVFLGGTSVFGGTGSIVGTFVASYIIGAINAGIVSAGINAFYTQLCLRPGDRGVGGAADHHRAPHPPPADHRAVIVSINAGNSRISSNRASGDKAARPWR